MYSWKVSVILPGVKWFILFDVEMHLSENGWQVLLERTAEALDEETMWKLLITAQHSNILLCIKHYVKE